MLVGLGNPGLGYARNRHNIGFMAVDAVAARYGFPAFRRKFDGEIADGSVGGQRVRLLKPQTYMNESGRSVGAAVRFHKVPTDRVFVLHDELDLAPGKVRVKKGGGAGGHNGIRSIDDHIGPEFWRVRLGIGHPGDRARVHGYVLQDFAAAERDWLEALLEAVAEATPLLIGGAPDKFMSRVALKTNPKPAKPADPAAP
ncbi:MAG: aminoacyl-tRNA hydrolase [Rhodospirillaceae bacterium]|nr:aminoacyl-tRNA hydrolase [Rhodospirillaceae bacterium]MCA8932943.1 aminoacyl-tRNA hydrolase [Rhodospirillaceae bacterium]